MKTSAIFGTVMLGMLGMALTRPALAEDTNCKPVIIAKLPITMQDNRATVAVRINGKDTRIWLDSGAFFNFMPKSRAVELGLKTEPLPVGFQVSGIGGSFTPELTIVRDFGIVGAGLRNMQFVVGGSDAGNGFLGANLLGVLDTEFDLAKGAVNMLKVSGCSHTNLAYWATGMSLGEAKLFAPESEHDHHIHVEVLVNGHSLHALLDTGAPISIIGSHAAARAGIDLTAPKVVASMRLGGIGTHGRKSWIVRTQMISVGGEEIRNSPIRVVDDSQDTHFYDMLLGVDFLMAHHVLVSQLQRKMYLTYNGGPIFSVSTDSEIGRLNTRAVNMGGTEHSAEPVTADQFAGRASGRLARDDHDGAIADYSAAIRLDPANADYLAGRATAYGRASQADLAARDIDAALVLQPADHRLLVRRAAIRLARGNRAGALADTDAAAAAVPRGSLDAARIAGLYERLGKADRALAIIDPVLALHRDDNAYPALLNARSWNRALANVDLDRALADCNTAIRKGGPNPGRLDTRALVQFRRKDYLAAIADANAALAINPKLAASLYVRGLAHDAQGDKAAATADIQAARAINPKVDMVYDLYGLAAPKTTRSTAPGSPAAAQAAAPGPGPAQVPDGDDDRSDQ